MEHEQNQNNGQQMESCEKMMLEMYKSKLSEDQSLLNSM
jgi:hypothetical protein